MNGEASSLPMSRDAGPGDLEIVFRLPVTGWPRAVFRSNYGYDGGTLSIEGDDRFVARSQAELRDGVHGVLSDGTAIVAQLVRRDGDDVLVVRAAGKEAPLEASLHAPPSRSAWIHGLIGLTASLFGFIAGYIYLQKAGALDSAWAMKMGYHTAAWHALLTISLFPASVWGQRLGIRSVQFVSLVFFCIHVGIALANALAPDVGSANDVWIALFNALSGAGFLASLVYGNRAYRDMDPIVALRDGRAEL